MPIVSYMCKEVSFKVVYCGPPFAGKTTSMQYIAEKSPPRVRGKANPSVMPHPSEVAFDFVPSGLGMVAGFTSRLLLSTLRGTPMADAAWRAMLKDVDAIVFVADAQRSQMDASVEARADLRRHLEALERDPEAVPMAIVHNKRDLGDVVSIEEANAQLNARALPWFEGVATEGKGVFDALKAAFKPAITTFAAARRP